jgi:hypothetical protein
MTTDTCTTCGATFSGGSKSVTDMAIAQHMNAAHGVPFPPANRPPVILRPPAAPTGGLPTGSVTLKEWQDFFAGKKGTGNFLE